MYDYTCQSCGVVGELEEEMAQVSCPACGGVMLLNRPAGQAGNPAAFSDDGEPTVAIPREASVRPRGPIKVAKAVDKGFGNMLARTTGPFAPYKQRDTQPRPAVPDPASAAPSPAIPVAQVVNPVASPPPPPSPPPKTNQAEPTQGGAAKKFTMNKPRGMAPPPPSPPPPATPPTPAPATRSAVQRTGMSFKKKGGAPPASSARPAATPPPTPSPSPRATMQKTGMTFRKKGATPAIPPTGPSATTPPTIMGIAVAPSGTITAPASMPAAPTSADLQQAAQFAQLQQQLEAERRARIEAEQEAMSRRQATEEAARQEAIRREAERLAQEQIRQAQAEAERRIAEERAKAEKLAAEEAERARRMAEEAARLAAQQAAAEMQARLAREREEFERRQREAEEKRQQEVERLRREKEHFERQQREAEEARKKQDAEFLRQTVSKAVEQSRIEFPSSPPASPPKAPPPPSPGMPATASPPSAPGGTTLAENVAGAASAPPLTAMTPASTPDGIPELSLKPNLATPAPAMSDSPPPGIGMAASADHIPELSLPKKDDKDVAASTPPPPEAKTDTATPAPGDTTPGEAQKPAECGTAGNSDKIQDDEKKDADASGPGGKKKPLPGKYVPKKGGRPLPPPPGGRKPGAPAAAKPKGGTATRTAVGIDKVGGAKDKTTDGNPRATKPVVDANGVLVTHTGLIRIKARKTNTIYIIIGIAVVLSLIPIYFGTKAMKSGFSRMSRKAPPAAKSKPKDPATTARQEAAQLWSPYDDEFRGIKAKVAKLPWNSAAEIDVHIAIWQEFLDSHPDADPNDKCIKLAREQLKNMQDLRAMW